MKIIEINDNKILTNFIVSNPGESGSEFLSSSEWASILIKEKKTIKYLAVVEEEQNILGLICLTKKSLGGRFVYWYAGRSPIFKLGLSAETINQVFNALVLALKKIDKQAVFLRIEPAQKLNNFWEDAKFICASDIQPKKTLVLNLQKTEEELLTEMHQKTRYNINLAKKKRVNIIEGGEKDFSEFIRLMELTGARDSFRIHDTEHYQNLVGNGNDNQGFIKLFFAQYEGKKIAAAVVCYFSGKATYLHGASDNEFRNIMAPYLLQWEIIRQARIDGFKIYDFYGIDGKKWPGVTRFKLGFGGEERSYPGVFDIPFKSLVYYLYVLAKKVRKILK
jgi:lipid II:glycine glycyltransferase (peptidoglycan interpeptide bridge formation enzyme)